MERVSVKNADLNLRAADNVKSAGRPEESSDEFRKLLEGQKNNEQEVSKDTEPKKKPEAAQETSKEPVNEQAAEGKVEEDTNGKESNQTVSLLAAYQMLQNVRPEIQTMNQENVEPEVVVEEETLTDVEMVLEAKPEAETTEQLVTQGTVAEQAETLVAEKIPVREEIKMDSTKQEAAPDAEVKPEASTMQEKPKETGREDAGQTDSRGAEQMMQPQTAEPLMKTEVQEIKQPEPVRMQVPQPEELPEKVTEQLMAKISEGVQEFEIHIEPVNLGKIAVKILYHEGQATVSIMCSEKRTFEMLGRSAGEIGQVIEKNLGGTTTIIVDKQESDYLNQTRDENQKNGQNSEQEQQKESKNDKDAEDAEQFLQKLRLGLVGWNVKGEI
ncbi:flagellar hook-length control protein FliK [Lachnospiraceae bacterium 42-17]|jgi:flagellar hook-length control protein FliK|nr:flagellar hook-length control protein FliK [Dorea sp.]